MEGIVEDDGVGWTCWRSIGDQDLTCLRCGNVPEITELLGQAMSRLVDFVTHDKQETPSTKVQDPDPFNGSDPKKLQGFLLECKLNFWAQLKAFCMENAKVNYAMSFLKGTALDYFERFLDTPNDEPAWLEDYELFIEELLINFSPYDAFADTKVELDALIMKDNHKVMRLCNVFTLLLKFSQFTNRT